VRLFRHDAADGYRRLSVNARLAGALHVLAQVVRRTGLNHPDVQGFIDHLWQWPTVTPETFGEWEGYHSPALDAAMGDPLTPDLEAESRRAGVDPADLRHLLAGTAEIVYHALFSVPNQAESLGHLRTVERLGRTYGASLPAAELFEESPWSANGGWGRSMAVADVERWRTLSWPKDVTGA
jgi:hypothetical protein